MARTINDIPKNSDVLEHLLGQKPQMILARLGTDVFVVRTSFDVVVSSTGTSYFSVGTNFGAFAVR